MWTEVSRLDLHELVAEFAMPVVFLLGRNDHWVPAQTNVAFFETLSAPAEQLFWFLRALRP